MLYSIRLKRQNEFSLFSALTLSFLLIILFVSCVKEPPVGGGGTGVGGGSNPLSQRIILDTAYGTDPNQKMDIYLPAGRTAATKVVIYIHGGGWESGSKADPEYQQHKELIRQKWPDAAVATINYRLTSSPAVHYTQIMSDIGSAVSLMVNNKAGFVISDTLTMVGASAGAHLAMLYTYKYNTNNYVKAVADFFGPAKLSDWSWYNSFNPWAGKFVKDILIKFNGTPWDVPLYDSNSPFSVANTQSKPTIIFHGTLDVIVPLYQSQWMRAQLNTLGVPNEYYEYLDGHGFNYANTDEAMSKTVAFLKAHLR
jgi:acetyl esterase/lipase